MAGDAEPSVAAAWQRRYRQFIPRPASTVAWHSAPWSGAHGGAGIPLADTVARLRGVLTDSSPDPEPRPHAAVLIPLFELAGDTAAVLIRRSLVLLSNPGDLAFPGGRLEPGERAVDAALREAHEEVGLPPEAVRVLGRLPVVHRSRQPERVIPYVGTLAAEPKLRPQAGEVDAVLVLRLSDLTAEGVYWEEEWAFPGEESRVLPFFADPQVLGEDVVWGMTAMVLRELLTAILTPAGREAEGGHA